MATVRVEAGEVAPGNVSAFQIEGRAVAVANVDGELYAFDDLCTHRGCSLATGTLAATSITCPCHFSVFDVRDGSVVKGPAREALRSYGVRREDGALLITLEQEAADEAATPRPTPADVSTPEPAPQAETESGQEGAPAATGQGQARSVLASVPLFADLDAATIERLEAFTFRKRFRDGELIVEEGRTGNGLYVVLSGNVEVAKGLGGPHPQRVALLGPGEPFGEMALLGDWKRSASVRAVGEVECLGMDRWAFLAHLRNEPNLAIRMLQMLAQRLADTNRMLAE